MKSTNIDTNIVSDCIDALVDIENGSHNDSYVQRNTFVTDNSDVVDVNGSSGITVRNNTYE